MPSDSGSTPPANAQPCHPGFLRGFLRGFFWGWWVEGGCLILHKAGCHNKAGRFIKSTGQEPPAGAAEAGFPARTWTGGEGEGVRLMSRTFARTVVQRGERRTSGAEGWSRAKRRERMGEGGRRRGLCQGSDSHAE